MEGDSATSLGDERALCDLEKGEKRDRWASPFPFLHLRN